MTRPAVFLDRDGTLIEDLGFLGDPDRVAFYPATAGALRRLRDFVLFIVTNQNGIARGEITEEQARAVNDHVVARLAGEGVEIRAVYTCPHQRSDGCECIKPNPHFLKIAAREHDVDLAVSFVVGDHPSDVRLAAAAGATGIYLLSGHGRKHRADLDLDCPVVEGIAEAADLIARTRAVALLRAGGLVAFPTETVYGLGADAMNREAVERIFRVKGRPAAHPLIVHLPDASMLTGWATSVPAGARTLAERFWPGPLTLVLPKAARVPPTVTGGQETVGLRVPSHPIARAMLAEFGGGVAAPSANRFGGVSPTTADHVRADLGDDVDFVLDGGPCAIGVESTIVGFVGDEPVILRPGGVPREAIEAVLGRGVPLRGEAGPPGATPRAGEEIRAPGTLETHYSPRARVTIVPREKLAERARSLRAAGRRVVVLTDPQIEPDALYASLRRADAEGAEIILVALPGTEGLGLAVADRLTKAAGPKPQDD